MRRYYDPGGKVYRTRRARDEAVRLRVEDPEAYRAMESWRGTFGLIWKRRFGRRRDG